MGRAQGVQKPNVDSRAPAQTWPPSIISHLNGQDDIVLSASQNGHGLAGQTLLGKSILILLGDLYMFGPAVWWYDGCRMEGRAASYVAKMDG